MLNKEKIRTCLLFQVQLENKERVNVEDFLSGLETSGLKPNRVTYQLCHDLLCVQGDTEAAALLVSRHKLAMSDSMLAARLEALIANKETEAATSLLSDKEVLSGELVQTLASSYGRQGDWARVQETLTKAGEDKVKLSNPDILKVMAACSQGGLHTEAASLMSALPGGFGFASHIRNIVPEVAMAGNVQLAAQLYLEVEKKKDRKTKTGKDTDGLYLARSLITSGANIEAIVEAVVLLDKKLNQNHLMQNIILEAAKYLSMHECNMFHDSLKSKLNRTLNIPQSMTEHKLVHECKNIQEQFPQIANTLNNLHQLGYKIPFNYIAKELIPSMQNERMGTLVDIGNRVKDGIPCLNWTYVSNLLLTSAFNIRTENSFKAAANFVLNVKMGRMKPEMWKISLAASFQEIRNVDEFINIIVGGIMKSHGTFEANPGNSNVPEELLNIIYEILVLSGDRTGNIIRQVLHDLESLNIGISPTVGEKIINFCDSKSITKLVSANIELWQQFDTYWTDERKLKLIGERKSLSKAATYNKPNFSKFLHLPDTIEELETINTHLSAQGKVNNSLIEKLITGYIREDRIEDAISLYESCNRNFYCTTHLLDAFVKKLKEKDISGIEMVMHHAQNDYLSANVFATSLMTALSVLAKKGEHGSVIDYLNKIDKETIILTKSSSSHILLSVYAEAGDVENMENVVNCLVNNNLLSPENVNNLFPLIDVHLANDDSTAGVTEFVRITRNYSKQPRKHELTVKLIEDENIEGIQTVLDASIELNGEEHSLYDLAYSFMSLGKVAQARKLLETPGLQFNKSKISYLFSQLEDLHTALDFLNSCKPIFGSDTDFMYHSLVNIFKDNPDIIEELWEHIKKDHEEPSDILQRSIAETLELHGRPVSFKVKSIENMDDVVYRSLEIRDPKKAFKIVMDSFQDNSTSLKCKTHVLDWLIRRKVLIDACLLATKLGNNFAVPEKIMFKGLIFKLLDTLPSSKRADFLKTLNPALRRFLKEKARPGSESIHSFSNATVDLQVTDAVMEGDVKEAGNLIKGGEVSYKTQNQVLSGFLDSNNLESALEIGIAICHNDRAEDMKLSTKDLIISLLKSLQQAGQLTSIQRFVNSLGHQTNVLLRGHIWVKTSLIKCDPESYVELLYTEQENPKKWMVNTEVLTEAVANSPKLVVKIEQLADQGFVPAAALAAKMFLAQNEFEKFEKYLPLVPDVLLKSKRSGIFDKVDTIEKMTKALEAIKRKKIDETSMENVANNCMAVARYKHNHLDLVEVAHQALFAGVKLEAFAKSTLVELANSNEFKLQETARKMVNSRFILE